MSADLRQLHSSKIDVINRFRLDLEGITNEIAFQRLTEKGKWESSIYKKADAARPFVREDSRSTVMLDAALGWNEVAF